MKKTFKRFLRAFIYSPPIRKLADATRKLVLPGFDGMPLYDVADFFSPAFIKELSKRALHL